MAGRQLRLPYHKDVSRRHLQSILAELCRSTFLHSPAIIPAESAGCLACLVLRIRVIQFFQANIALCPVRILKAAVQTVVPHAVAVAVARLLVHNIGDFFRQFIGVRLEIILGIVPPKLLFTQESEAVLPFRWRRCIVCRNTSPAEIAHGEEKQKQL